MKKIIITFSIFFGGYYLAAQAGTSDVKFEFNKYSMKVNPEDTNKTSANYQADTTQPGDRTQQVMDSINNSQYSGVYYGNFNNEPVHVEGRREPNSYKSGRTGGQYDAVVKPGMVPIKKQ
jgi:hypothetical protein